MLRDWAAHRVSCFQSHENKFCETCAIIFNTASPVNKFMKQQNKKIKNVVYVAAHAPPFSYLLTKKAEVCRLTFTTTSLIANISKFHFFLSILIFHFAVS